MFSPETPGLDIRGFGKCRIENVVTLKFEMLRGRNVLLSLISSLIQLRIGNT
jgi:hypothetical protein